LDDSFLLSRRVWQGCLAFCLTLPFQANEIPSRSFGYSATAIALPDKLAVRAAFSTLVESHESAYPHGQEFLQRLETIECDELGGLQRQMFGANPFFSGRPVLFITQTQ
jgi:hypothetical protein